MKLSMHFLHGCHQAWLLGGVTRLKLAGEGQLPATSAPFPVCHLILHSLGHRVRRLPPPKDLPPAHVYPDCREKKTPPPPFSSLYTPPENLLSILPSLLTPGWLSQEWSGVEWGQKSGSGSLGELAGGQGREQRGK